MYVHPVCSIDFAGNALTAAHACQFADQCLASRFLVALHGITAATTFADSSAMAN